MDKTHGIRLITIANRLRIEDINNSNKQITKSNDNTRNSQTLSNLFKILLPKIHSFHLDLGPGLLVSIIVNLLSTHWQG